MTVTISFAVFIFCKLSFAQDVSFEATVDHSTIELGSSAQLRLTINGSDSAPPVQLPKMEGLETRYLGPSTQISINNGQMSRSVALIFTVIPLKTGPLQIPAIPISLNGKDYSSQPITLNVVNAGTVTTPEAFGGNHSVAGLQDKIFIIMGTAKKEVYLNEPIPLVIKLFINELQVKNVQYPSFGHDGFAVQDFNKEPPRYQQDLGGITYQVIEFKTMIYPTRTGDLTLGPARLAANILIKSSRRTPDPFGQFGSVFDEDALNSFFGMYDVQTVSLESAELGIRVLPLPEEGKPQNFESEGAVGKYDFEMTVSPTEVKVGDPVTVRMKITGDGNLKAVTMPAFKDMPDFKFYDPKITEIENFKTLEQVAIPMNAKIKELPAVNFSYFDPSPPAGEGRKKYNTITKGPFPLTVTPLAKGEEMKIVGLTPASPSIPINTPEELGHDLRFSKEDIGRLQKQGAVLYQNMWFIFGIFVLGMGWFGLFFNYQLKRRLATDVRFARRLQAPRQAKRGLAQAKAFLPGGPKFGEKNNSHNFYDTIFKTLQEYFGNKFHLAPGNITVEAIARPVAATRFSDQQTENILKNIREVFRECELVRYASADVETTKMNAVFAKTEEIIDFFERNYK